MKAEEFIKEMESMNVPAFTTLDVVRITGKKEKYVSLFLSRMVGRRLLSRIEKGKYYLPGYDIYSIASNIVYPSYISLLSAFRYHRITTQIITVIDIISAIRHSNIKNLEEHRINFINLGASRVFGFYRDNETNAFVAHIEKAIVDSLYLQNPPYQYIEEALNNAYKEDRLDVERMVYFAQRMDSVIVMKRLGEISNSIGIPINKPKRLSKYEPV
jgi:predicted transcriptional regulator of viral defense system